MSINAALSSVAIVRLQWKDIVKFHVIFRDSFCWNRTQFPTQVLNQCRAK